MRKPRYGLYGAVGPARGFTWNEVRCTDGTLDLSLTMRRRYRKQARNLNRLRKAVAKKYGLLQPYTQVSIIVNSWYRSPNFNASIGGAKFSQHVQGRATDLNIVVTTRSGKRVRLSPGEVAEIAGRSVPAFTLGGIGTYPGFCHVDHRPNGPARWHG
jgi:uncharacterized protein YcbK (DUF882 family)